MRTLLVVMGMILVASGCRSTGLPPLPTRIVDLTPVITPDLPIQHLGVRAVEFLGIPERLTFVPVQPANPDHSYGLLSYHLPSQIGAHIDVPGRLLKNGTRVDQVPLNRLIGPGKVLDLRWKDYDAPLHVSDLQNYRIEKGDLVVLFFGYRPPSGRDWPRYPTLSLQAAQWLATREVAAILTDAPSIGSYRQYQQMIDQGQLPERVWAERLALFQAGVAIIEGIVNVEEIVGEERVMLLALPLPIAERAGAPARVVALVY